MGFTAGLAGVIDVLKLITELKIQQARYANPLTLLPGNVPIQQCLTRLLQQGREAVVCYVDIDNFKPFNEMNRTICENDEQLGELIALIVSTIEENFELTPKFDVPKPLYQGTR